MIKFFLLFALKSDFPKGRVVTAFALDFLSIQTQKKTKKSKALEKNKYISSKNLCQTLFDKRIN
jgi:hypothetical protein